MDKVMIGSDYSVVIKFVQVAKALLVALSMDKHCKLTDMISDESSKY